MNAHRAGVFTVEERNRIHERILEIAHGEERIVAGAVVGSLAAGEGDRWVGSRSGIRCSPGKSNPRRS